MPTDTEAWPNEAIIGLVSLFVTTVSVLAGWVVQKYRKAGVIVALPPRVIEKKLIIRFQVANRDVDLERAPSESQRNT